MDADLNLRSSASSAALPILTIPCYTSTLCAPVLQATFLGGPNVTKTPELSLPGPAPGVCFLARCSNRSTSASTRRLNPLSQRRRSADLALRPVGRLRRRRHRREGRQIELADLDGQHRRQQRSSNHIQQRE